MINTTTSLVTLQNIKKTQSTNSLNKKDFDVSIFNTQKSKNTINNENSPILKSSEIDTKENFEKHQEYKNLTTYSYDKNYDKDCENWENIKEAKNDENGFFARVFKNSENNEVVISYRGTNKQYDEMITDLSADEEILKGQIPKQYKDAKKLYDDIKKENPNTKITLTGHSLGGSLAQLVASDDKTTNAITFNALGTKQIIDSNKQFKNNKNCINYSTSSDVTSNLTKQIGETRTIDTGNLQTKFFDKNSINKMYEEHDLKNFDNLENSNYLKQDYMEQKRSELRNNLKIPSKIIEKVPNLTEKIDTTITTFEKIKSFTTNTTNNIKNFFKKLFR